MGIQVLHCFNQSQSYIAMEIVSVCVKDRMCRRSSVCAMSIIPIHCIMLPATVHVAELYAFVLAHTTVALWLTLLSMIYVDWCFYQKMLVLVFNSATLEHPQSMRYDNLCMRRQLHESHWFFWSDRHRRSHVDVLLTVIVMAASKGGKHNCK